ncbi:MAG TPA: RNB domain-containing ribonuclease [Gaiellales bacterium]|nr:RNB domain-containing ribonuclease [Gaiellales bacterium]
MIVAEPYFEPGPPLTLGRRGAVDAAPGELVSVIPDGRGRGLLDRVLGTPGDPAAVMLALAVEDGAARAWPAGTAVGPPPVAGSERVDLRGLDTMTIDPEGAKDHDDALSVDGDRVYVHIADVSAHVAAGSALDAEAGRRGTSVYLPGRVDAMLPAELSADRCSLRAGEDRLAVSLCLGPADAVEVSRSVIRSDHTLTYPQAQAILDGASAAPELEGALRQTARLADELRSRRMDDGALAIETREIEIRIADGAIEAHARQHLPAHQLIEELMILANRRVAELVVRHKRPALHRVHEPPDAGGIEVLLEKLEALGVPTPPVPALHGGPETARYAGALSRAVMRYAAAERRGVEAWPGMVLRAMQKARYDPAPLGHSGIAAPHYCHFTSPIRRYPDLVCHRALLAALGLGGDAPSGAGLGELAARCSEAERDAERLERRGTAICLAFLLERRLFDEGWDRAWEGEVVGLIEAGAFVRFGEVFEGFLPARLWRGERATLDPLGVAMVDRSGRRLRLGDGVTVAVESIDRPRGRVAVRGATSS